MMAAIGINVSTRDATIGWEAIMPDQVSSFERSYRIAKRKSDDAESKYINAVDNWESTRERGFDESLIELARLWMDECERQMDEAAIEKDIAYKQLHCPHTHTKNESGVCGDVLKVCRVCGAVV